MMYPLVRDLAADGIPVAVTCRVLGFPSRRFYAWNACPVTDRDWSDAHLTNAAIDIHTDDPNSGTDSSPMNSARPVSVRPGTGSTGWCAVARLWSTYARERGINRRPGLPVHDDLVARQFRAAALNRLWLTDITEHRTVEVKLYLCAVKDACSNRIVGYSIADTMTAQLAVDALHHAVTLRRPVATTVHSDLGSQFRAHSYVRELRRHGLHGSMG